VNHFTLTIDSVCATVLKKKKKKEFCTVIEHENMNILYIKT